MDKSLLDIVVSGGWVMIPILLCSIAVIAIGWNRFSAIRAEKRLLTSFVANSSEGINDVDRFLNECQYGPHGVQLMYKGIRDIGMERQAYVQRLETAANGALFEAEKGLGALASLAAVAPMLGFLGTVTGMIGAFMQIQSLGGNVNANVLAGGIWEALVTTAAGLVVGIPTVALYNYLTGEVKAIARLLEECSDLMLTAVAYRDGGVTAPPTKSFTPKIVINLPNPHEDDYNPPVKLKRIVKDDDMPASTTVSPAVLPEENTGWNTPPEPIAENVPYAEVIAEQVADLEPMIEANIPPIETEKATTVELTTETPPPVPTPPVGQPAKPNWRRGDDSPSDNPLPFRSRFPR